MSTTTLHDVLKSQLDDLQARGLYKRERQLQGPQGAAIQVGGREVINFCANNYLGLANHPAIVKAAHDGLAHHGYGLSSVRFICGTQDIHKQLEGAIAKFLGKDDAILYSSCWDANGGLFETVLGENDVVLSDELNHASIIDGVRLCKARRVRYKHNDLADLEQGLKQSQDCRLRLIATDGVFSMDGDLTRLPDICQLADRYQAVVMVDDSHATGILGPGGKGSAEALGCLERIDIITSTLGKTLGGATGGFTCASQAVVDILRQRSRPYLFSNSLSPPIVSAAMKALELIAGSSELRDRLHANARALRAGPAKAGVTLEPGEHPLVPVLLGQARIRIQLSAAHTPEHLDRVIRAFTEVGKELGVL